MAATTFEGRVAALRERVNAAATALQERGVRPTVARIRAALGGGSPNDLTPALRAWRDTVLPRLQTADASAGALRGTQVPLLVSDVMHELWQRALAAAAVELRGGPTAQDVSSRTAEAYELQKQVESLRNGWQRDLAALGELRAQSARREAIAKSALSRADQAESRERSLLIAMAALRERLASLEAEATFVKRTSRTHRVRSKAAPRPRKKNAPRNRTATSRATTRRKRKRSTRRKTNTP